MSSTTETKFYQIFSFLSFFLSFFASCFFLGSFLFLAPRTIPECSAVVSERVERRYSPRIRQVVERLPCAEATHPSRGLMSNTHATSGSSQAAKLRFGQFICGCPPWPMAACTDVLLLLWCAAFISFRPQVRSTGIFFANFCKCLVHAANNQTIPFLRSCFCCCNVRCDSNDGSHPYLVAHTHAATVYVQQHSTQHVRVCFLYIPFDINRCPCWFYRETLVFVGIVCLLFTGAIVNTNK